MLEEGKSPLESRMGHIAEGHIGKWVENRDLLQGTEVDVVNGIFIYANKTQNLKCILIVI
jgi:hypothetical protein